MRPLMARIVPASVRATFSRSSGTAGKGGMRETAASGVGWPLQTTNRTFVGAEDEAPMSRREVSLPGSTATTLDAERDPETPPLLPVMRNDVRMKGSEGLL